VNRHKVEWCHAWDGGRAVEDMVRQIIGDLFKNIDRYYEVHPLADALSDILGPIREACNAVMLEECGREIPSKK